MRELHLLALFVHGALSALHALGVVYNIRRGNRFDTAVHLGALCYSARSAVGHGHMAALRAEP